MLQAVEIFFDYPSLVYVCMHARDVSTLTRLLDENMKCSAAILNRYIHLPTWEQTSRGDSYPSTYKPSGHLVIDLQHAYGMRAYAPFPIPHEDDLNA